MSHGKIGIMRGGIFFNLTACIFMLFAAVLLLFPSITFGSEQKLLLPPTERIQGERLFGSAYHSAIQGRIEEALRTLDEALDHDPYLVSYYLLKSYCLYLRGDYSGAIQNIHSYLEVNAEDPFARGFLKEIEEKKFFLETAISRGTACTAEVSGVSPLWDYLEMDFMSRNILKMPGRPSWRGNVLALCDLMDDKVYLYDKVEGRWVKFHSGNYPGIVRVLPDGDRNFYMIFSDGSWKKAQKEEENLVVGVKNSVEAEAVSDAALLYDGRLVISDRFPGRLFFLDPENTDSSFTWQPEETRLFEPVSLAAIGPLVAVADRQGNRIFILEAPFDRPARIYQISGRPRSVAWLSSEKLVVLTEEAELYELSLNRESADYVCRLFPEAWFLFSTPEGEVAVTDTRFFRSLNIKPVVKKGFISLRMPGLSGQKSAGMPGVRTKARFISPLGIRRGEEKILHGILSGGISEVSVSAVYPNPKFVEISTPEEIMELIGPGNIPSRVVLDLKKLSVTDEELMTIGSVALANGIIIDIRYSIGLQDLRLVRLCEATGGRILNRHRELSFLDAPSTYTLEVYRKSSPQLPGNPRAGGIFITGRSGSMTMQGRIPFWSAFLELSR